MVSLKQEARVIERCRVVEVAEQESVTEAARRFGCSRTTVYKLISRYREGGLMALANRPRGPRESVPEQTVDLVVELKAAAPHRSTAKIQHLLREQHGIELSRQSVWRILSARGLARLQEPEPLVRFERPRPNALWQMDLKEDVQFPFGKAHLLCVIDDASRYCVGGRWIPDKKEPTVLGALADMLEQAGLPEAILTDRAMIFYGPARRQTGLTTYRLAMDALGVKTNYAKPYKPRTKGKIERLIGFIARDFIWEIRDQVDSIEQLQRCWEDWLQWYDHRRPHSSLGDLPPAHRYQVSHRAAPANLRRLLAVEVSRRVDRAATISLNGRRYDVPPKLMGKHVWVGRIGEEIFIEYDGKRIATHTR
jgi:transposase InsO family protein